MRRLRTVGIAARMNSAVLVSDVLANCAWTYVAVTGYDVSPSFFVALLAALPVLLFALAFSFGRRWTIAAAFLPALGPIGFPASVVKTTPWPMRRDRDGRLPRLPHFPRAARRVRDSAPGKDRAVAESCESLLTALKPAPAASAAPRSSQNPYGTYSNSSPRAVV